MKDISIKSNNHYLIEKFLKNNKEKIKRGEFDINKNSYIRILN
jgi:hypothetical protein